MSIRVERDGAIAVVTLDRPPVNAVSLEMQRELRTTFESFAEDRPVR